MPNAVQHRAGAPAVAGHRHHRDPGRARPPGPRRPGPPVGGLARGRRGRPVQGGDGRVGGPPGDGGRDRLHRRGRRRVRGAGRGRRGVRGRPSPPPAPPPPGSAPATRCGSRRACPSTATSSARGSPRCRPGSPGWSAWDKPSFRGKAALVAERAAGVPRRAARARHRGPPAAPARGQRARRRPPVGEVTSGNFSPMLGAGHRPRAARRRRRLRRRATRSTVHERGEGPAGAGCTRCPSTSARPPECPTTSPTPTRTSPTMLGVPRPRLDRRAVRRRPGRAAAGRRPRPRRRASPSPTCWPAPGRRAAAQRGRRSRLLRRRRRLRPRGARRSCARSPAARSS